MELISQEQHGDVHVITMDRPGALNALSSQLVFELNTAISALEKQGTAKALVLASSSPRAFSAGADVKEIDAIALPEFRFKNDEGANLFNRLEKIGIVTVAALNGYVLGGGLELALACDLRVATPETKMAFPEIGRGFIPGWGGIARLVNLAGLGYAKEAILLGENLDIPDALNRKILNRVVPPELLFDTALELAQSVPADRALNLRYAKHLFAEVGAAHNYSNLETLFVDSLLARSTK